MKRTPWGLALAAFALALAPGAAGAATITPNILTDELNADGDCSLREAVQSARSNTAVSGCVTGQATPTADTIVLGAATYTLNLGDQLNPTDENLNQSGDLDFGGDVVLIGAGRDATTITTALNDRIIDASAVATRTLTLEALTVEGGNTTFGLPAEVSRGGNVRLRAGGNLVIRDARVTDGSARRGAGIYADGSEAQGSLTVTNSLIDDNHAQAFGGGLHAIGNFVVRISGSTFDENQVSGTGSQLLGGGIDNLTSSVLDDDGSMTITDSVISNNSVLNFLDSENAVGGGIRNRGPLTVRGSLITGNLVGTVGDLDPPQNGGGIWQESGPATIVNSTIHGNEAGNDPGDTGRGGGIDVNGGAMTINHTTFSSNAAGVDGGDSLATGNGGGAGIAIGRSIIPGSGLFGDPCSEGDLPIASSGFNSAVTNDLDCGFVASDTTSAALGTVPGGPQDNGGPTQTIAILSTGTAFDKVPAAQCGPAGGVDQRGYPRPSGGRCDAGAFELQTCAGKPATITGTNGADVLLGTSGQDLIAGLGGNDKIKGLGGKDLLCGLGGKDRIVGGGGKDVLMGGKGADRLNGGSGRDRCVGGPGKDRAKSCERKRSV